VNDQELRELIQQELESHLPPTVNVQDVVRAAVQETLITMGMDVSDPLQLQQDMAFLRDLRRASDTVKTRGILVVVGLMVTAIVGAAWLGIKAALSS
jgi:hypothetical protein